MTCFTLPHQVMLYYMIKDVKDYFFCSTKYRRLFLITKNVTFSFESDAE